MKCLKKLLLLFLLSCTFMFCIPVLSNNSFAAISYTYNGNKITLPEIPEKEGYTNYLVYYVNNNPNIVKLKLFPDDLSYYPYVLKTNNNIGLGVYTSSVCSRAPSYSYNIETDKDWTKDYYDSGVVGVTSTLTIVTCTSDIYYTDGNQKTDDEPFYKSSPKGPYIVNSLDNLSSWKFDNLWVDYGSYDTTQTLYLHICKKNIDVPVSNSSYYTDYVIALSTNGKYYESYEDGQVYYFSIPKDNLPFTVSAGDKIIFYLSSSASNLGGAYSSDKPLKDSNILDTKTFTVGTSYTDEDKQKDYQDKISSSLEDQKQAIEENTKTNKNIFEKIGDILSYINPFSENFFGKKLVELILDGLKGLFVPEDGFFDTYFSDLKNWFSDRLGFLWTPFDIIIEILNKILNINFSEPIFHIPEINEPFSGSKLISKYDYNLNSLLDNDIFKNIHDIYFIGVDAVIIFALINLARRKIEEVFSN